MEWRWSKFAEGWFDIARGRREVVQNVRELPAGKLRGDSEFLRGEKTPLVGRARKCGLGGSSKTGRFDAAGEIGRDVSGGFVDRSNVFRTDHFRFRERG